MNISKKTILASTLITAFLATSSAHAGKVGTLKDYSGDTPITGSVEFTKIGLYSSPSDIVTFPIVDR